MSHRAILKAPTLLAILAILLEPLNGLRPRAPGDPGGSQPVALAQSVQRIFIPAVTRSVVQEQSPEFAISSPLSGSVVSGVQLFEAQPADPASIRSVEFQAGNFILSSVTSVKGRYRAFLDASTLPQGPLQLRAIATGTNGQTVTKSMTVTIEPNAPSSAMVTALQGATLGTASGGTLVIPPGSVESPTTVQVRDKTKEEIKAETGIDYDALGITFLGAFDIQSSGVLALPLGVNTAGFVNRVKPGEAIVTFRIVPNSDGTGSQLVVVNSASLGPSESLLTDPAQQLLIRSILIDRLGIETIVSSPDQTVALAPGSFLTALMVGVNAAAVNSTIAVFRSGVDGSVRAVPATLSRRAEFAVARGSADAFVTAVIPVLPAGSASVRFVDQQTGRSSREIILSIAAAPSLARPAADLIDEFLARTLLLLQGLPLAAHPPNDRYGVRTQDLIQSARPLIQQLAADPDPVVQQSLREIAAIVVGSGTLSPSLTNRTAQSPVSLSAKEKKALALAGQVATFAATIFAIGLLFVPGGAAVALTLRVLAGTFAAGGAWLALVQKMDDYLQEQDPAPCRPSPGETNPSAPVGIGGAPPPGGAGCGDIISPSLGGGPSRPVGAFGISISPPDADPSSSDGQAAVARGLSAGEASIEGRYLIRIYSLDTNARRLIPFTAVSDRTGYFHVPFLPAGAPVLAHALDTVSSEVRTNVRVGPTTGSSAPLIFDFTSPDLESTPITMSTTISQTTAPGSLPKVYQFASPAGQVIGGTYGWQAGSAAASSLNFQLLYPNGIRGLSFTGISGTNTLPDVVLPMSGTYTLLVSNNVTPTGGYTLTLTSKPAVAGRLYANSPITTSTVFTPANFSPNGIVRQSDGSLLVSGLNANTVVRVDPNGQVTPYAGTGTCGFSGDNGPATQAQLCNTEGMAIGPDGSVYVADWINNRVRQILPGGTITTFAGTGGSGFSGDGGPARLAQMNRPTGVAVAGDGTVYIANPNNGCRIRVVSATGVITTYAGTGTCGFTGDNGPATQARLNIVITPGIGPDGAIYLPDRTQGVVRRVALDGTITTIAGRGTQTCPSPTSPCGDGGPATSALLHSPEGIAFGPDGSIYISEAFGFRIRRIGPDGIIHTIAGTGVSGKGGDGGPAGQAQLAQLSMMTIGPDGTLYVTDLGNRRVVRISP